MPLPASRLSELLQSRDALQAHPWRLATGSTTNSLTVVANTDGTFPYIRQLSINDRSDLALIENYSLATEVFQISLVGTPPADSSQFWLNLGDGYRRVKFITKQRRALGSHWWIVVSRESINA